MHRFSVRSTRHQELIDVTDIVQEVIRSWDCNAVMVYVPHTTAGVLINEHADPDVALDVLAALDHMVPGNGMYRHSEGNSPAHVKSILVGTSQCILTNGGKLLLGTWQGIFLAEFDGPRTRQVVIAPVSPGSTTADRGEGS